VPAIVVVSAVSLVVNLYLLILFASKTQTSGGYDTTSVIGLAVFFLTGLVIYVVAKEVLKRRRFNLDLTMAELPPD
jgi:hypothetical protein